MLEDAAGSPARFSILTQAATCASASRRCSRNSSGKLGIAVDIVAARSARALSAVEGGRLRRHLFRAAGELDGPGAQPGLLAELGALSFLEPGAEDPGDAVGAAHRRADARAVDGRRPGRAPARVRRGAADHRRGAAVDLLRRRPRDARHVAPRDRTRRRPHRRRTFSGARRRWRWGSRRQETGGRRQEAGRVMRLLGSGL